MFSPNLAREVGWTRISKYFLFSLWQLVFRLLPFFPLRTWWLRLGGARIGADTVIDRIDFMNLDRGGLSKLNIGQRCFIGVGTVLDLAGSLTLKDYVTVSPRVVILSHFKIGLNGHPLLKKYPQVVLHTQLEFGCFIGTSSVILAGVNIGRQAIVAAGSVVTQQVPDSTLVAGNPALVKKHL